MQTKRPIKNFTTERITELIKSRVELIHALQVELDDFTAELEARQNPNPPVQLELF